MSASASPSSDEEGRVPGKDKRRGANADLSSHALLILGERLAGACAAQIAPFFSRPSALRARPLSLARCRAFRLALGPRADKGASSIPWRKKKAPARGDRCRCLCTEVFRRLDGGSIVNVLHDHRQSLTRNAQGILQSEQFWIGYRHCSRPSCWSVSIANATERPRMHLHRDRSGRQQLRAGPDVRRS